MKKVAKPRRMNYQLQTCVVIDCHCVTNNKAEIWDPSYNPPRAFEELVCPRHSKKKLFVADTKNA